MSKTQWVVTRWWQHPKRGDTKDTKTVQNKRDDIRYHLHGIRGQLTHAAAADLIQIPCQDTEENRRQPCPSWPRQRIVGRTPRQASTSLLQVLSVVLVLMVCYGKWMLWYVVVRDDRLSSVSGCSRFETSYNGLFSQVSSNACVRRISLDFRSVLSIGTLLFCGSSTWTDKSCVLSLLSSVSSQVAGYLLVFDMQIKQSAPML